MTAAALPAAYGELQRRGGRVVVTSLPAARYDVCLSNPSAVDVSESWITMPFPSPMLLLLRPNLPYRWLYAYQQTTLGRVDDRFPLQVRDQYVLMPKAPVAF
jgi:hypothetical protein